MSEAPFVLVAAHGSSTHESSQRSGLDLARDLHETREELGIAGAAAIFWKREPNIAGALERWPNDRDVIILPLFMSEGWFTRTALPRALGLRPSAFDVLLHQEGRRVAWMRPIGSDERLESALAQWVREACPADDHTLLLVGHGTDRDAESGRRVLELVAALEPLHAGGPVLPAFLDQAPRLVDVAAQLQTGAATVVPFFAAEGTHVEVDIPEQVRRAPASCSLRLLPAVGAGPLARQIAREQVRRAVELLAR